MSRIGYILPVALSPSVSHSGCVYYRLVNDIENWIELKAFIVIVFAYNEIWSAACVGAMRDNI